MPKIARKFFFLWWGTYFKPCEEENNVLYSLVKGYVLNSLPNNIKSLFPLPMDRLSNFLGKGGGGIIFLTPKKNIFAKIWNFLLRLKVNF